RSHIGVGSLRILVPVLLVLAAAGAFLLVTSPAAAGPPIDDLVLPVEVEETRDVPKRVQRQVQGQGGASITQTTPTPGTRVSNTGQPTTASPFALDMDRGQAFRTGTSPYGYKLTSVEIDFHTGGSLSARIYIRDGSIELGKEVAQLKKPPSTVKTGLNTFEATGSGVDLNPSRWYLIHLDLDAENTDVKLENTASDNEDSGKATGWEINDPSLHWPIDVVPTGGGEVKVHANALRIRVNGYAKVKPDLVKAEVNGTSLVLTYDNNLDTTSRTAARQFGIKFGGGGALQRATAISISGRQVTLTVPEVRAGQVVTVSYTVPTSNPSRGQHRPRGGRVQRSDRQGQYRTGLREAAGGIREGA
ncbi:MAG: SwmB domain-containing protein, partial [Chloroflexi bacterium]|nr:SwmB domain-containing protein [Chloroflexota bacterium]